MRQTPDVGAWAEDLTKPRVRQGWRVVDIVVAAVLAVAVGLIFWAWNSPGYSLWSAMDAATPGLGGLANGLWLLGGPLGMLVIRRPGAAIFVETVAAAVSMAIGNQWGWSTVWIGLLQGLGAELVFLAVAYRSFRLPIALLSGVGAGVGCWFYSFAFDASFAKTAGYNLVYVITTCASGAVLAGLLAWLLTRALARTGALNRFAAGREARTLG